MKTAQIILSGLLAATSLSPADAARRDHTGTQTVLVLGDSLSDGFGLSRAQAYPALLAQKARAAGIKIEVVNASVSGGTTAGGLERLPKHLQRRVDVFVLQLGINDAFRGLPVDQIRKNLQAMIELAKKRNPDVRVVLAGMQLPLAGADGYFQEFGRMYAQLAQTHRVALVPYLLEGVAGDPTLNLADHLHPNPAGQRILAENVWHVLGPILKRETATP